MIRLYYLSLLSLLVFLLSQLGIFWGLELFSHFLPVYVVLWATAAILLKNKMHKALCGGLMILGGVYVFAPYTFTSNESPTNTLIWYNINLNNKNFSSESAFLREQNANYLATTELNFALPEWQSLAAAYPYACEVQEDSPFAISIRAQKALWSCEILHFDAYPAIRVFDGKTWIYALHPPPPITDELAESRRSYLQHASDDIRQREKVLVVGDLNTTPYSPVFREFVARAAVKTGRKHFRPTWQHLLNLDHALSRHAITVTPLNWRHSDHRPLKITF